MITHPSCPGSVAIGDLLGSKTVVGSSEYREEHQGVLFFPEISLLTQCIDETTDPGYDEILTMIFLLFILTPHYRQPAPICPNILRPIH